MNNNKIQVISFAIALCFLALFLRLCQLQLIEGGRHRRLASENAAKTVTAFAPRGVIFDRNGSVLVENRPVFSVQVMPQLLTTDDQEKKDRVLGLLGELLGEKIEVKVSPDKPIIVENNIPAQVAMRIEEQKQNLEGVVITVQPVRYYPHGNMACHLLGYVGEIEAEELGRLKDSGYKLGDSVGKDGVEKLYDHLIRGSDGGKKIEVNAFGKPVRLIESVEPVPGADVKLTIDLEMQTAAEKALAGKNGAVVIIEPKTGEILALVSHPNFDPNIFVDPLNKAKWWSLNQRHHPFMNRALAIYPPGSIFKVITLTAVLEEKLSKPEEVFFCPGYYKVNNRIAKCWKEEGHGRITLAEGLTQSCDIVFYEMGKRLGPDKLTAYARQYGLGEKTGIDLPQEKKGLVPDSGWKKRVWKEQWYDGDSINYGIGQGFVQVTPLQMAQVYSDIALGKKMKPYLVQEIKSRTGEILYRGRQSAAGNAPAAEGTLAVIRQSLKNVVDRATGRAARIEGFLAAGKTGTAQNPGLPHAWFLCYAPADEPRFVIASFVEQGGHGDRSAAYVARDILSWYNENKIKKSSFVK